jgi:hypothetical protein
VLVANGLVEICEMAERVRYVVSRAAMLHTKWLTCGLPGFAADPVLQVSPQRLMF